MSEAERKSLISYWFGMTLAWIIAALFAITNTPVLAYFIILVAYFLFLFYHVWRLFKEHRQ